MSSENDKIVMWQPYPPELHNLVRWLAVLAIAAVYCAVVEICHADSGRASWYGPEACRVNPDPTCPTASGRSLYELERSGIAYAAMWDVPFGTRLHVCRADRPAVCTIVVVLDRGPARRLHRVLDLSRRAFQQLEDPARGLVDVTVRRLP